MINLSRLVSTAQVFHAKTTVQSLLRLRTSSWVFSQRNLANQSLYNFSEEEQMIKDTGNFNQVILSSIIEIFSID